MNDKNPMLMSLVISAVGILLISSYIFATPSGNVVTVKLRDSMSSGAEDSEKGTAPKSSTTKAITTKSASSKSTSSKSSTKSVSSKETSSRKEPSKREPTSSKDVKDDSSSKSSSMTSSTPNTQSTLSEGIFDDFVDPDESYPPDSSQDTVTSEDTSSGTVSSKPPFTSEPTQSDNISSEPLSSEEVPKPPTESSDSTTSEDEIQSQPPVDPFATATEKIMALAQKHQVDITVNVSDAETSDPEVFTNESDLLALLTDLENLLATSDSRIVKALVKNNIPLEFYLVPQNIATPAGIETIIADDCVQMILQLNPLDPEYNFYHGVAKALDEILWRNKNLKDAYSAYSALNPIDFTYGSPRTEYVNSDPNNCYFLSIMALSSIEEDRADLFSLHSINAIPQQYLSPSCHILSKLDLLLLQFNQLLA